MDSGYKKIKDMFSEENSKVPTELQWDKMEAGIMEKMDNIQAGQKSKESNSRKRIFIILGLFLLAMIPFVCTQLNSDLTGNHMVESVANDTSINDESKEAKNSTEQQSTNKASVISYETDNQNAALSGKGMVSSNYQKFKSDSPFKTTNAVLQNKVIIPDGQSAFVNKSLQDQNQSLIEESLKVITQNSIENFESTENSTSNIPALQREIVFSKPIDRMSFMLTIPRRNFMLPSPSFKKPDESEIKPKRVIVSAGPSLWSFGYGAIQPERAQFEKNLVSFQSQVGFIEPLKNNFQWMVGIQYFQLESRINWSSTIEDYQVTLENVVLEVQTNSLTGGQTEIIGDVEVDVEADRKVQHYNSSRIIQIPIALGYTLNQGKWQSDFFVGTAVNIISNNTGRTLFNDEIIDYSNNNNPIFDNQFGVNGLIATRLSYRIHQNWSISTGLQFQKSFTNWSNESSVSMRPQIMNWDIGLVYLY